MDPFVITFYALVCGVLGLVSPILRSAVARLSVGAAIGIIAASSLPFVRSSLGF